MGYTVSTIVIKICLVWYLNVLFVWTLTFVWNAFLSELNLIVTRAVTHIGLWTICIFHLFLLIGMPMKRYSFLRPLRHTDLGIGKKLQTMSAVKQSQSDLSHTIGKSKEELLAMNREHAVKTEIPTIMRLSPKEELPVSAEIKDEASGKDDTIDQPLPGLAGVKKKVNAPHVKDIIKLEATKQPSDRSVGEKKLRLPGDKVPSMTYLYGYNLKRQEFEIEYDNDAEQLLADMEFKDLDTDAEREQKLQVLHIYSKRLDERKRKKEFVMERNLLYPDQFEMSLSAEERKIYRSCKVFARFHSKEEQKELTEKVIEEHRILRRIQDLQEARNAGCRTSS